MNSIIINIAAYLFMTTVLGFIFIHSARVGKWLLFANFLLFCWATFMSIYLIGYYSDIMSKPLNTSLNRFETVSNILSTVCILVMYLNMRKLYRKK